MLKIGGFFYNLADLYFIMVDEFGIYSHLESYRIMPEVLTRIADPDPNWIRIQSGQWIRIRIQEDKNYSQK
jgi:hypothetical protein